MATIDSSLLARLAAPEFGKALYGIGTAPAEAAKKRQKAEISSGLFQLEQAAIADKISPEQYAADSAKYVDLIRKNPDMAEPIMQSLSRVGAMVKANDKNTRTIDVNNKMSGIQSEFTRIYSDPSLSVAERDKEAARLRARAKQIQENNPTVDFSKYSNWDAESMNAGLAIKSRIENEAADAEQDKINNQIKGMDSEALAEFVESYDGPESDYLLARVNNLNAFNERERKRLEGIKDRQQNLNPSIEIIEESLDGLPDQLQKEIRQDINRIKVFQEQGKKNNVWVSEAIQKSANTLISQINERIDNYNDGLMRSNLRAVRETDLQIVALEQQLDNPLITQKKLDQYAALIATLSGARRPFEKMSASKKQEFYRQARQQIAEEHNETIQSQLLVQRALKRYLTGDTEETETSDQSNYSSIVDAAVKETGRSREEVINALQQRGDIPKTYTEQTESFEEAIKLSETDITEALFGEQGYILPLGLDGDTLSKALVNDRVYFLLAQNKPLNSITTTDLELLQYDNNKYTPRIKAELIRRKGRNG